MTETTSQEPEVTDWIDEFAASMAKCIDTAVSVTWTAKRIPDGSWAFEMWPVLGRRADNNEPVFDDPAIRLDGIVKLFTQSVAITYYDQRIRLSGKLDEKEIHATVWTCPSDDAEVEYVLDPSGEWQMLDEPESTTDADVRCGHVATPEPDGKADPDTQALYKRLSRQIVAVLALLNTPDEVMLPMARLSQSVSNTLIGIKMADADAVAQAADDARESMDAIEDEGLGSLVAACAAATCVLAEMDDMRPDDRKCVACAIRAVMTGEPGDCARETESEVPDKTMLN